MFLPARSRQIHTPTALLTLLVQTRAPPSGTRKPLPGIATRVAVRLVLVGRAGRAVARARLGEIATAVDGGTADGARGGVGALVGAAGGIGGVAYCARAEHARWESALDFDGVWWSMCRGETLEVCQGLEKVVLSHG